MALCVYRTYLVGGRAVGSVWDGVAVGVGLALGAVGDVGPVAECARPHFFAVLVFGDGAAAIARRGPGQCYLSVASLCGEVRWCGWRSRGNGRLSEVGDSPVGDGCGRIRRLVLDRVGRGYRIGHDHRIVGLHGRVEKHQHRALCHKLYGISKTLFGR